MHEKFDAVISVIISILLFAFGELTTPLLVLLIFMGMDYITGLIKAYITKQLSSKVGLKGLFKKILILIIVSFCCMIDKLTGTSGLLRNFVIFYYIVNEGLSILENISASGIELPDKLKDALLQVSKDK